MGLVNLTELVADAVKIVDNKKLCFLEHFSERFKDAKESTVRKNAPHSTCFQQGKVCDKTCDAAKGCWGPGPSMCVACARFEIRFPFRRKCVMRCEDESGFRTLKDNSTCAPCHRECARTCSGPGPDQCIGGCKNYKVQTVKIVFSKTDKL